MADQLHLEVVTPRRQVLSIDVDSITLPGAVGEFKVHPNHRPFLTSLVPGRFIVEQAGNSDVYYLGGGFAEILPGRVVVLADECIARDDIDADSAREALAEAETKLAARKLESFDATVSERLAMTEATAQINISQSGE